jgi:hypothetical protein
MGHPVGRRVKDAFCFWLGFVVWQSGSKSFDESGPLVFERGTVELFAGASVPVIGV